MTAEKHDSRAGGSAKPAQPPVVPERRTFFGVVIGLITAGIAGLLGVTIGRYLIAPALVVIAGLLFVWSWRGEEGPEQPIAFSHRIHAGDYKINCLFCHDGARRSPVAGAPAVQRCIGCHSLIPSDRPEIQKLNSYWESKKPIEWTRIHRLPNFTRFNHERHVSAGVTCQTCHGPLETMERVRQVSSLQMGWCIQCHRQRSAPTDCVTCHY